MNDRERALVREAYLHATGFAPSDADMREVFDEVDRDHPPLSERTIYAGMASYIRSLREAVAGVAAARKLADVYDVVEGGYVHYTRPEGDPLLDEARARRGYEVVRRSPWEASFDQLVRLAKRGPL